MTADAVCARLFFSCLACLGFSLMMHVTADTIGSGRWWERFLKWSFSALFVTTLAWVWVAK